LYTAEWAGALIPLVALGTIVLTLVLIYLKLKPSSRSSSHSRVAAILAIGLLFIAPVVWSCTPLVYGSGNILPAAGPQLAQGSRGMPGGTGPVGQENNTLQLAEYLTSHSNGETWLVAVPSSHEAASLILETGRPVMSLGGFSGSDTILSTGSLTTLLKAGKVRYFSIPSTTAGGGQISGNTEIFSWVSSHCTAIPASEYGAGNGNNTEGVTGLPGSITRNYRPDSMGITGSSGSNWNSAGPQTSQSTLYDCAGAI